MSVSYNISYTSKEFSFDGFKNRLNYCATHDYVWYEPLSIYVLAMPDRNIKDNLGNTIVHLMAKRNNLKHGVLGMILDIDGIDIDIQNNCGETVLDILIKNYEKDHNENNEGKIRIALKKTKNISLLIFNKMMDKKFLFALCSNANLDAIVSKFSKKETDMLLQNTISILSEILLDINCDEDNIFEKYVLKLLLVLAKKYNFETMLPSGYYIYDYIMNKIFVNRIALMYKIILVGELMSLNNSKFILKNKTCYTYYVYIGTVQIDKISSRHFILKNKILNVVIDNMHYCLTEHKEGRKSCLLMAIDNLNETYIHACIDYLTDSIVDVTKYKNNPINSYDLSKNTYAHYVFAYDVSKDRKIKDFYKLIMNSGYKYLLQSPNLNGYIPYNISMYGNYFTFGKELLNVHDIIKSFTYYSKETVAHSMIISSSDYSYGHSIDYELKFVGNTQMIAKSITYNVITHMGLTIALPSNTLKLINKNTVIKYLTYVCDEFVLTLKPYIYRNKNVVNMWSLNESVADEKKIKLLQEIYEISPKYVDCKDVHGRTCYMTSVMINSIEYTKLYVDIYTNIHSDIIHEKILCRDLDDNNVFHFLAYNNNHELFALIIDSINNINNDNIKKINDSILFKNKTMQCPLEICIENNNFHMFMKMFEHVDTIDDKLAISLVSQLCFKPDFNDSDTELEIFKKINNKIDKNTKCDLYKAMLYDLNNVGTCNIMHYCCYNKKNNMLKHLISMCVKNNDIEYTKQVDHNNMTILLISLLANNYVIVDLLAMKKIVASEHETININDFVEQSKVNMSFNRLIINGMIDINYVYNGKKIIHRACEYGHIFLIKTIISEAESNNIDILE